MPRRIIYLLTIAFAASTVNSTSIDMSPKKAALVGDNFITYHARNSLALYAMPDGRILQEFSIGKCLGEDWKWVEHFDITNDGKRLLIGASDGSFGLWSIETGKCTWWKSRPDTGLGGIYDICLSHDGNSFVVCGIVDKALICETATGKIIQIVTFPPNKTNIMSAALSPDGTTGVLIDLGERLYFFDVSTGRLAGTGIRGAWPVRFSTDGTAVAFRSANSGTSEQLRLVSTKDRKTMRDVGQFRNIGHIRPLNDGRFLLCAWVSGHDQNGIAGGYVYDPPTDQVHELWKMNASTGVENKTDFSPETLVGVSTDFRLVTVVADLATGSIRLTTLPAILPGAAPEPTRLSRRIIAFVGIAILVVTALAVAWRRRNRINHRG